MPYVQPTHFRESPDYSFYVLGSGFLFLGDNSSLAMWCHTLVPIYSRTRLISIVSKPIVLFGLLRIGLESFGLGRIGLEGIGLERIGLERSGLERIGLERIGLEKIGKDWIGKDWIENN